MELKELIKGVSTMDRWGDLSVDVTSLHYDSRRVGPGSLFFALAGVKVDGQKFIARAMKRGRKGSFRPMLR